MSRLLDSGIAAMAEDFVEVLGPVAHDAWTRRLRGRFVDMRNGERFELAWNGYGEALIIKPRPPAPAGGEGPDLALIGCSASEASSLRFECPGRRCCCEYRSPRVG